MKKSILFSLWVRLETRIAIIENSVIFLKTKKQKRTKLKMELSDDPLVPGAKGRPTVE